MLSKARNLITSTVRGLTGGSTDRSEAAQKAARTRTRQANARSAAAKRGAQTRKQRDARVDAMRDATKRD
jgi:hypothetical protein